MSDIIYPTLTATENDGEWRLHEAVIVKRGKFNFTVPEGFLTDLASVRWWMKWVFPNNGKASYPAVVHDYLYKSGFYSKEESDRLFYELLVENKIPKWKAYCMYMGVFWFGCFAWFGHRRNDA